MTLLRIKNSKLKEHSFYLLMGMFLLAVSLPVLLLIPEYLAKNHRIILGTLIFPSLSIQLFIAAAMSFFEDQKFYGNYLELYGEDISLGAEVNGYLIVPRFLEEHKNLQIELRLSNFREYFTTTGKGGDKLTDVIWQDVKKEKAEVYGRGLRIPVRFIIPSDAQPTNLTNPRNKFFWRFEVYSTLFHFSAEYAFDVKVTERTNYDLKMTRTSHHGERPFKVHSKFLFFRWEKIVNRGQIKGIEIRKSKQRGKKIYYDLQLLLNNGKRLTVATRIGDQSEAERIRENILESNTSAAAPSSNRAA